MLEEPVLSGADVPAEPPQPLTDETVEAVESPSSGMIELADNVTVGLRIRVSSTGMRTFILRRRVQGKMQTITLGRFSRTGFGVEAARSAAVPILQRDSAPRALLKQRQADQTMRALVRSYLTSKGHLKSVREIKRILHRDILPHFGDRQPETISRSEITSYLDEFKSSSTALAAAAQLHAFFSWYLPRCDALTHNPCSDAGRPPRIKARDRILTAEEIRALWKVSGREGAPFGTGVRLLMLTLQRRSEVFGAHLDEFDLGNAQWLIPAARTKNCRSHFVPLSVAAVRVLRGETSRGAGGLLFPSRANPSHSVSGFSKAWKRMCEAVEKEMGRAVERFTMHDLRRTGATMLQSLGVRIEVTEAVLNHVTGSRGGIVGVYQRHHYLPEKTEALSAWARHLEKLVGPGPCNLSCNLGVTRGPMFFGRTGQIRQPGQSFVVVDAIGLEPRTR